MVQENEAITLLLGVMTLAFLFAKRTEASRLPDSAMLVLAFGMALLAWVATVVEEIALPGAFNLIEHVSYATSSVLIALWCWKSGWKRSGVPQP